MNAAKKKFYFYHELIEFFNFYPPVCLGTWFKTLCIFHSNEKYHMLLTVTSLTKIIMQCRKCHVFSLLSPKRNKVSHQTYLWRTMIKTMKMSISVSTCFKVFISFCLIACQRKRLYFSNLYITELYLVTHCRWKLKY